MRLAIGKKDFAKHENAVFLGGIGVAGNGLENTIRALSFSLTRGAAIKAPERKILQCWELGELLDLSFAAEVGDGLIAVEPDVFEFVLGHINWGVCGVLVLFFDQPMPQGLATKL
jgi:hypothetical protein